MWPIREIETDVLVVGGGIAGSRAAIEAKRSGAKTLLVTKGVHGSGTSVGPVVCAAVGPWGPPDDRKDLHFEGIVVTGRRFLCDQRHARILVDEAPDRLMELEEYGELWDRDENGNPVVFPEFSEELRLPEESHHYHKNRYLSSNRQGLYFGYTGHDILQVLRAEIRRRRIPVQEETACLSLFTRDGEVVGALALDYLHGEILVISAASTILSTGSLSQLWYPWGLASREMTGDGVAMAARAGAVISDLELMMTAYLPNVAPSWSGRHKLLQSVIECAAGYRSEFRIRWINAEGDEFLAKHLTEMPQGYEELYLKVIRAVHIELEEGRGPLYMDYRSLPREFLEDVAPFILKMMDKLDRDEGEYLLEIGPNPMWSFGGVKIDEQCASNVPGLYACGDASNAIKDGFGASVACGVTTCLVTGKRSGEYAAEHAGSAAAPRPRETQVREELTRIEDLLEREKGCSALEVKQKIGALMRKHMHLKNEAGMTACLAAIRELRQGKAQQIGLTSKGRAYNYELVEAFETNQMIDAAEMLISASLMRKESRRHLFIREDYPKRDDANWLRHINIRRIDGELKLETVPVEFPFIRPDATGLGVEGGGS